MNACVRNTIGSAHSVLKVASGEAFTLILTTSGNVFACGRGREGQLGLHGAPGSLKYVKQPTAVEALLPWRIHAIACGSKHSVAASTSGATFEWGLLLSADSADSNDAFVANMQGLGRNFVDDLDSRQQQIVAESWSRYLVNDPSSESIDSEAIDVMKSAGSCRYPVRAPRLCAGLDGVVVHAISCGFAHTVAVTDGGSLAAAGYNEKGQLGNGSRLPSVRFISVDMPQAPVGSCIKAVMIASGLNHSAVVLPWANGKLLTWGLGTFGQIGLGHDKKDAFRPSVVPIDEAVVQIAAGDNHTVALTARGQVYAFGHRDALGGNSHQSRLPERVQALHAERRVRRIFAGGNGSFAMLEDDNDGKDLPPVLHAWGYNQRSQLGRNTANLALTLPGPTCVPRLPGAEVRAFDAGTYHCVAVLAAPQSAVLSPDFFSVGCFGAPALLSLHQGNPTFDVAVPTLGGQILGAHHCVLQARCCKLASRLRESKASDDFCAGRPWILDLSNSHAAGVAALLEYLYSDRCITTANVAAALRPLAEELGLSHLVAGIDGATQTESAGSGVRWMRTAAGSWVQVTIDEQSQTLSTSKSTYAADLAALVREGGNAISDAGGKDYVKLILRQVGHADPQEERAVMVARPLLLTVDFFGALLEGHFAEAQHLRDGALTIEVTADCAEAFIMCLKMLATGEPSAFMPACALDILAVLVEAHRLDLADVVIAAELALSQAVTTTAKEQSLEVPVLKTIASAAAIYDLDRLASEAGVLVAAA